MSIFTIVWLIWCASEVLLNRLIRSGANDKKKQDRGSLIFIWLMIALAISSGIVLSKLILYPISNQSQLPYIGLFIVVLGMVLRFFSIWSLGRFFTVDVTIRDNHEIKKDGLYKILRHPSYSGSLLSFIGFGVSLNNWLSLVTIIFFITIAFLNRIRIEEKALIEYFGDDYLNYKKNTYRIIPWIY